MNNTAVDNQDRDRVVRLEGHWNLSKEPLWGIGVVWAKNKNFGENDDETCVPPDDQVTHYFEHDEPIVGTFLDFTVTKFTDITSEYMPVPPAPTNRRPSRALFSRME